MKKQSGFTLIELLLVLAIIGIISAIAIPALLSQRARARDKTCIANVDGFVSDGVGQYDKFRELGTMSTAGITTSLSAYLKANHGADKNPWVPGSPAYDTAVTTTTGVTSQSGMVAAIKTKATTLGQAEFVVQYPTSTTPGFWGGGVLVQNIVNGSTKYSKATGIE
jgi:prepilin-type N-terminal cleavage/methylation domain-containing protein